MDVSVGLHEVDVYSDTHACLLGQKPWIKRRKKTKAWLDPTILRRVEEFRSDDHDWVIGDLPGKVTNPFLSRMVEPADAAILVFKDGGLPDAHKWLAFFMARKIPVLSFVLSEQGKESQLKFPFAGLEISTPHYIVRDLNREVKVDDDIRRVAVGLLTQLPAVDPKVGISLRTQQLVNG